MKLISVEHVLGPETSQVAEYEAKSGDRFHVFFRCKAEIKLPERTDHFFIVGALAAFLRRESYEHSGPVSRQLLTNFHEAMRKWSLWWSYRPISIHAETAEFKPSASVSKSTGSLMSGGVDSLFTAGAKTEEIDFFVNLVHCGSGKESSPLHREHVALETLAGSLKKSVFWVDTNIMTAFPEIEDAWTNLSHGPCMGAVGHFLNTELSDLLISASFAHDQMRPWGSHPSTDELYSSESFRFRHVGADFSRFQKHRAIVKAPGYLEYLSVCEHGPQQGKFINCSKCQKCLRSMITLDLLGTERSMAPTFDWTAYDPADLKHFLLQGHVNCSELLTYAEEIGRDDIVEILSHVIKYSQDYRWIVSAELFVRRRFSWLLRFKPALKRVRLSVYAIMNIRPRRLQDQSQEANGQPPNTK